MTSAITAPLVSTTPVASYSDMIGLNIRSSAEISPLRSSAPIEITLSKVSHSQRLFYQFHFDNNALTSADVRVQLTDMWMSVCGGKEFNDSDSRLAPQAQGVIGPKVPAVPCCRHWTHHGGREHAFDRLHQHAWLPPTKRKPPALAQVHFLNCELKLPSRRKVLLRGTQPSSLVERRTGRFVTHARTLCTFRVTITSRSQKPTKWALPNKGVESRAARDLEQDRLDRRTVESSRSILERKAKLYKKLKKGQSGGLSEAQFDALLVNVRSHVLSFFCGASVTGRAVRRRTG